MISQKYKESTKKILPYLLLLLYSVLVFYQVAFFRNTFKWDYISYSFPVRYYVSECIRSGHLPLWMLYEGCGYPVYGDPQSGAWYPVVWLISIIHGYDIYAASFEFMLTIFIAGAGFYTLATGLKISSIISFIVAAAYMTCGFFVGNSQHLSLLISGAYLPFIIHFYLRLNDELNYRDALCTAFFLFLNFTGGYPAISFILIYFLLALFIAKLIPIIRTKEWHSLKRFFSLHALLIFSFLMLSLIFIISITQGMPFSTRAGPLPLGDALLYAFTPQCFLSFITPYALQRNIDFFDTDLSMSNGYFGIVFLIFLFYFLMTGKTKRQYLFLALAIIFLAASLGESTPVRTWLYYYVPLMNYFHYPSVFRIFFIFLFLLLAGFSVDHFLLKYNEEKPKLFFLLNAAILLFLGLIIIAWYKNDSVDVATDKPGDWKYFMLHSSFYNNIILQSFIQVLLLLPLLLVIITKRKKEIFSYFIVIISLADMFIATQLNMKFTVVTPQLSPQYLSEKINTCPDGFPLPDSKTIAEHNDYSQELSPLWQNLNLFFKQVAPDGYNPLFLKRYQEFLSSKLPEKILNNPLCYFPKNILLYSSLSDTASNKIQPQNIYLDETDYKAYKDFANAIRHGDSCSITRLEPNHISITAHAGQKRLMVLLQNNFNGWQAKVNGEPVKLLTGNYTFMVVPLSQGENKIELIFNPTYIHLASGISVASLLLCCVLILI